MIRENQKLLNRVNLLLDGVLVAVSMPLAFWLRFYVLPGGHPSVPFVYYLVTGILITPVYLLGFTFLGLYESQRRSNLGRSLIRILGVEALCVGGLLVLFFGLKLMDFSRLTLLLYVFLSTGLLLAKRIVLMVLLRRFRRDGRNQKFVLLVGSGKLAQRYVTALNAHSELGFQLVGYVGPAVPGREQPLGNYQDLEQVLYEIYCDEVVAALEAEDFKHMDQIIAACEKAGVRLVLVPFYTKYTTLHPEVDLIGNLPLINIRRVPLDNLGNAFLKRAVDLIGSAALLVLTSPVMLLAAIGTKLSSPGPVIFRQQRVGRNKKVFTMYKLRSMRLNATQETGWTTDDDSRKTKFGALLRKTSIDELPQFFNVLKGDMSLVGPRPEVPHYVEQFKDEVPLYMVKHQVRPGITGWAQVKGFRGDTSIKGRIEHDIFYIENWSLAFDLKILFMTLFGGLINSEKL